MILNNSGLTPPERLLEFLRSMCYGFDNKDEMDFGLHSISNHKGDWDIEFKEVPAMSEILGVLAFFTNEQEWDNLVSITFNATDQKPAQRFEGFGDSRALNHFQIAHIISCVAIETEDRAKYRHRLFR